MKKMLVVLMASMLTFSLTACGNKGNNTNNAQESQDQVAVSNSLEILETVWGNYADDEKFAAAGGDMNPDNMTMDAPGNYGIEDADLVDNALGYPAASIDKIDGAASLVHMMNANTFTCGVYHVKESADVTTVAEAIKENIMARQWMCGFPDKLIVANIGDYVVAFFGENDIVDTFKNKLTESYPSTTIISEDPIA